MWNYIVWVHYHVYNGQRPGRVTFRHLKWPCCCCLLFYCDPSCKLSTHLSSFNNVYINPETAFQSQIFILSVNWPFTVAALLPCPICMCTFPLVTIYTWDICQVLEAQVVFSAWVCPRSLDLLLAHSFMHFQTFLLMCQSIIIMVETWVLFCLRWSPHICSGKDYQILGVGLGSSQFSCSFFSADTSLVLILRGFVVFQD